MLNEFLKQFSALQAGKYRKALERKYNYADVGIATVAEMIESSVKNPGFHMFYACGTTKKRQGERFLSKPKWCVGGYDVPEIGAKYANWLLDGKYDLEEMKVKPDADYAKYGKAAGLERDAMRINRGW